MCRTKEVGEVVLKSRNEVEDGDNGNECCSPKYEGIEVFHIYSRLKSSGVIMTFFASPASNARATAKC